MKAREIIKHIMTNNGIEKCQVAKRLGLTSYTVFERLKDTMPDGKVRADLQMANAVDMARAIDYKVVLMPNNCKLPDGAFEVTK